MTEVTKVDVFKTVYDKCRDMAEMSIGDSSDLAASVCKKLFPEPVKLEDRVEIFKTAYGNYIIKLDKKDQWVTFEEEENAKIFRLGLIEKLKGEK